MSEPTRTITPRLHAAILGCVGLLDELIAEVEPAGLIVAGMRAEELRAELLEAFEEAKNGETDQ